MPTIIHSADCGWAVCFKVGNPSCSFSSLRRTLEVPYRIQTLTDMHLPSHISVIRMPAEGHGGKIISDLRIFEKTLSKQEKLSFI